MFRRFSRVIREAFLGIKNHGAMTFSSVSAVTMTLLIIGVFFVVNINLQHVVTGVENSVQIHAKIEVDATDAEISSLKTQIENISEVKLVTFSSKDDELRYFMDSYGEQGKLFEMYVGEENPMRNAFLIEAKDATSISKVAAEVEKLNKIESVNYGGSGTVALIGSMEKVKRVSYIVVVALAVLAILLIVNTIDTTIANREDEIHIMRYVGATNGFVRGPFLIEGLVIGVLGSLLPILIVTAGYLYLYSITGGQILSDLFELVDPNLFLSNLDLGILGAGVGVGVIGSFISVTRKLWGKR